MFGRAMRIGTKTRLTSEGGLSIFSILSLFQMERTSYDCMCERAIGGVAKIYLYSVTFLERLEWRG